MEKYEQILDAVDNGRITEKQAAQMLKATKGIVGVADLEMRYLNMMGKFGHKMPAPRSDILRGLIGDGQQ